MGDDSTDGEYGKPFGSGVLLMKTWNDGEAETVRQILANHDIPCQVVSDVPHSVWPITVDGLGELRIHVPASRLEAARALIEEHLETGGETTEGTGEEPKS